MITDRPPRAAVDPARAEDLIEDLRGRLLPEFRAMAEELRADGLADPAEIRAALQEDCVDAVAGLELASRVHQVAVVLWLEGIVAEILASPA